MQLDINFNFGEFQSEGGHTVEILIAIFSIIGTVILTVIAQRLYDNLKKNESLDSLYTHTKKQAIKFGEAAIKQAKELKDLIAILKAKEVNDFKVGLVSEFNSDLIKDWDSLDFYFAIVSRRKGAQSTLIDHHTKIKATLNGARTMQKLIEKYFDDLNLRYKQTQGDWQSHVQSIGDLLDYYKINAPGDEFLKQFDSTVYKWKNSKREGVTEMSYVYDNLVIPLRALDKQFPNDIRAYQLERELLRLYGAYIEMEHLKTMYASWFEKTASELDRVKTNLSLAFGEVDKMEVKSQWQIYSPKI